MAGGRLDGRHVLITGAGQGIGRATAERFAAEGARVGLIDLNPKTVAEVAAAVGGHGFSADVSDPEAIAAAVNQAAEAMGGIDGVVTSAGVMMPLSVAEMKPEQWRKMIDVNLSGTFYTVQAALPWLRKATGASVVNIASAAGLRPDQPKRTAYGASKGGVVNLARAFAAEFAPEIRVNCVCPGLIDTPMVTGAGSRANVGNYALRRIASPAEIANVLLFLTSDEASYVTGAVWAADGGRSYH